MTDESSVDTGESTVAEESESQTDTTTEATATEETEKAVGNEDSRTGSARETKQEKEPPFHEHPRFKELIEQNRAFKDSESQRAQAFESMQRELSALREASKPKVEPVKDPFLADLEKVNPAYAKSLQSMYDRAAKAEDIERRLQQYESQQFAEKAYNHFDNLLKTAKVSDVDKEMYKDAIEARVFRMEAQGKKLGLKDLDGIFNEFHTKYAKQLEDRNRDLLKGYVKEKAKDKAPAGATGGSPAAQGAKKLKAGDISGQSKWLADQIRALKKEH